jgi:hypothetical protein
MDSGGDDPDLSGLDNLSELLNSQFSVPTLPALRAQIRLEHPRRPGKLAR